MTKITRTLNFALLLSMSSLAAHSLAQEQFPNKPVRVVVPQGAGGGTDIELRVLQPYLSKYLGQPVIVENKAGAGGIIGAEYASRAPNDGYTIIYLASSYASSVAASKNFPVDPIEGFSFISQLAERANVVVVSTAAPFKTTQEYINYARANPGKINIGTSGPAQSIHLAFALMHSMSNSTAAFVHYKESGQRMTDLVSGRIHTALGGLVGMRPFIQSGKVRAIGVTTRQRIRSMPDVPTIAESGVPGYEFRYWTGFAASAKTSRPIVDRLRSAITSVAKDPEMIKTMEADGGYFVASTPEEFRKLVQDDIALIRKIVADNNITLE